MIGWFINAKRIYTAIILPGSGQTGKIVENDSNEIIGLNIALDTYSPNICSYVEKSEISDIKCDNAQYNQIRG
jgi:hypothetical protein